MRWVLAATLVVDALAIGLAAGLYATVAPLVPDEATLGSYQPQQTTKLYARDGTLLASLFEENRQVASISEMPRPLVQATIAIEDQRFNEHPGVDPRGIFRAFRETAGGKLQGASTITQQLAREVFLSQERTVIRKLKEMTLAIRIERRFSKDEILGLYLNQICYGHQAYGVAAAADTYFGKKLDQLTLAECALIAGLAKNPSGYNPIDHADAAKGRRDMVLYQMWRQGFITQAQYDEARAEPVHVRAKGTEPWKLRNYRAPWFTTYIIDQLVEQYGHDKVFGGGLQIYTTIDLELQAYCQQVLDQALRNLASARANRGAIVCIDPRTGAILAMVGGSDFSKDEFNAAWQAYRQPGSSMKPYVYVTAMEKIGLKPSDTYSADPETFNGYWGSYSPENFDDEQGGMMTCAMALAKSVNLVAVRVIIRTGPQNVVDQAHKMGLDRDGTRLKAFPALALGASEVCPLEHCNAYCAFANGGYRVDSYGVEQITDTRGSPVYRHDLRPVRVMSPRSYTYINTMMQGVINFGTGVKAAIDSPCAGKTGTTNSAKDAWFMGVTPGFCSAIWLGNDANNRMWEASGGDFCAPLWRQIALFARDRAAVTGLTWPDAWPRFDSEGPSSASPASGAHGGDERGKADAAKGAKLPPGEKPPTANVVDVGKDQPPGGGHPSDVKPAEPKGGGSPGPKPTSPSHPEPDRPSGVQVPPKPPTPKAQPPTQTPKTKPTPGEAPEPGQ
jgi:penicillin-binding protein 1A